MKKIIAIFFVLVMFIGSIFSSWEKRFYVDEFGDNTDQVFLTTDIGVGSFSNSATTDSDLLWSIRVENPSVEFLLWEYGSYMVKGGLFDDKYTIRVRDDNKNDHVFSGYSKGSCIGVSDSENLIYILATNKSPRINIKEQVKYGTASSYKLGTVNTEGFAELYKEEYGIDLSANRANTSSGVKVTSKAPSDTQVGDILIMGQIPSSEGTYSGEAIAWKVLGVNKTKSGTKIALVISEKVLTEKAHSSKFDVFSWENSEIKKWLNKEFITDYKLQDIKFVSIKHETETYTLYDYISPVSGQALKTDEKIFLLSKPEVEKYFANNNERMAFNFDGNVAEWSLRSPDSASEYCALTVSGFGKIGHYNYQDDSFGIRPAFWLYIE